MFDHNHNRNQLHARRHPHRHRDRDMAHDIGREMRGELRRSLRRGAAGPGFAHHEFKRHGRPGQLVRRGEVRPLILNVLQQKQMHGYEVIQELESQSGGRWRPSAGSIYPTLQQLSDEGLVTSDEVDGRRTYTLTDVGRKVAAQSGERSPWTEIGDTSTPDLRQLSMQFVAAVREVQRMGSPRARTEATRVLTDARKQMYRLLSEDEDTTADEAGASA